MHNKRIKEMRNYDPDPNRGDKKDTEDVKLSEAEMGTESESPKKGKEGSWWWTLVTILLPFPLGIMLQMISGGKQKWYQYLVLGSVVSVTTTAVVIYIATVPMMTKLDIASKTKVAMKYVNTIDKDHILPLNSEGKIDIGMVQGGGITTPNYGGSQELDYTQLQELEDSGTASAVFRAQRFQLYLQLANMFDVNVINLYGLQMVESNISIDQKDMYADYSKHNNGASAHSIGPFQISSSPKHLRYAFESQYSTRANSPKDNSVLKLDAVSVGIPNQAESVKPEISPIATIPDVAKVPYKPTKEQEEWAKGITSPGTDVFTKRLLDEGAKTYGADGGSTAKHYLRPSPFYIPDGAYSQFHDMKWLKDSLMATVDNIIAGGNSSFRPGYSGSTLKWRELHWTVDEAKRMKALTSEQFDEIAFMYFCDWYLGSLASNGGLGGDSDEFKAWGRMGIFGLEVIEKKGTMLEQRAMDKNEWWKYIDGRTHSSDWEAPDNQTNPTTTSSSHKSLVRDYNYYITYRKIQSGNTGSKVWEAFTYGIRGINQAWGTMVEDKRIYELGLAAGGSSGISLSDYHPPLIDWKSWNAKVTSTYHKVRTNSDGSTRLHHGIDVGANPGMPIYAIDDGVVVRSQEQDTYSPGYGEQVWIFHPRTEQVSVNAHMIKGSRKLKVGDTVTKGDKVGEVGTTGSSTGNHLHFEIRENTGATVANPSGFDASKRSTLDPTPLVMSGQFLGGK